MKKEVEQLEDLTYTTYETPLGEGILIWRNHILTRHIMAGAPRSSVFTSNIKPVASHRPARALGRKLEVYFSGEPVDFPVEELPVDWSSWTVFELSVVRALAAVVHGQTISYAGLAFSAGYPRAHRAVGNVMAKNPYPLLIPCHRVIRSDGKPGGFSGGNGWKEMLLHLERSGRVPREDDASRRSASAHPFQKMSNQIDSEKSGTSTIGAQSGTLTAGAQKRNLNGRHVHAPRRGATRPPSPGRDGGQTNNS